MSGGVVSDEKRRAPLAFLGRLKPGDWRRALILAEILAPPLARRGRPPHRIHGLEDDEARRRFQ